MAKAHEDGEKASGVWRSDGQWPGWGCGAPYANWQQSESVPGPRVLRSCVFPGPGVGCRGAFRQRDARLSVVAICHSLNHPPSPPPCRSQTGILRGCPPPPPTHTHNGLIAAAWQRGWAGSVGLPLNVQYLSFCTPPPPVWKAQEAQEAQKWCCPRLVCRLPCCSMAFPG